MNHNISNTRSTIQFLTLYVGRVAAESVFSASEGLSSLKVYREPYEKTALLAFSAVA